MIKTQKYKVPLYGNRFTLIVYEDYKELEEHLPDYDFDQHNIADFDGCVFTYNDAKYITFKRFVKDGVQYPTVGIIAHESKHLTNNIFIDIGQRLDAWNDEAECYLLQWIVNRVHEFLMNNYKTPDTNMVSELNEILNTKSEIIDLIKEHLKITYMQIDIQTSPLLVSHEKFLTNILNKINQ